MPPSSFSRLQHRGDQCVRVAMMDAQRVAWLVGQAAAFQRQLDMAHVLVRSGVATKPGALELAAGQRLVGQQFGGEGFLARERRCGMRAQRGDRGQMRGRRGLEQFAGVAQRGFPPGCGDGVDVQVRFAQRLHARGAEFAQSRIQLAGDAAEVGVGRIAQPKHRVLQLRQLWRALAVQEFDEADGVVRRVAFALGADDKVKQLFAGQLAGGVGIGAHQPHGQPGRLQAGVQRLGSALGIAGLAAVEDRGRLHDGSRRGGGGERGGRQRLRQSGQVAGGPEQRRVVGVGGEARQQAVLVGVQGSDLGRGGGRHGDAYRGVPMQARRRPARGERKAGHADMRRAHMGRCGICRRGMGALPQDALTVRILFL